MPHLQNDTTLPNILRSGARGLRLALALLLLCGQVTAVRAEFRMWTNAQGKKVEAEFVSLKNGTVQMKLRNGKPASVALDQLSQADKDYVKKATAAKTPAPAPAPEKPAAAPDTSPSQGEDPVKAAASAPPLPGDIGPKIPALPALLPMTPDRFKNQNIAFHPALVQLDAEGKLRFGTSVFESLELFSTDNLAWAEVKNPGKPMLEGFIDPAGKFVLGGDSGVALPGKNRHSYGHFQDGLCAFRVEAVTGKAGEWGYMDRQGKVVIEPAFKRAKAFSNGLAPVNDVLTYDEDRPGAWRYIDRTGKTVLPGPWLEAHAFDAGGLALIDTGKDDRTGAVNIPLKKEYLYINKQGQPLPCAPGQSATPFANGVALVQVRKEEGSDFQERIIDRTGKVIFEAPERHYIAWSPDSGVMLLTWSPPAGTGTRVTRLVLQETGVPYGPPLVGNFEGFLGGLASFRINVAGKDQYGCIDRTGKVVIEPKFPGAVRFVNGLALTWEGKERVIINTTGKIVYRLKAD